MGKQSQLVQTQVLPRHTKVKVLPKAPTNQRLLKGQLQEREASGSVHIQWPATAIQWPARAPSQPCASFSQRVPAPKGIRVTLPMTKPSLEHHGNVAIAVSRTKPPMLSVVEMD